MHYKSRNELLREYHKKSLEYFKKKISLLKKEVTLANMIATSMSILAILVSVHSNYISNQTNTIAEKSNEIANQEILASNEGAAKDIITKESHNRINEDLNKIVSNLEKATRSLAESTKEIKNISEQQVSIANRIAHFSEQQTLFASQQTDFAKQQVEFSEMNTDIANKTYALTQADLKIIPIDAGLLVPQRNIVSIMRMHPSFRYDKNRNEVIFLCTLSNASSIPISILDVYIKIDGIEKEIKRSKSHILSYIADEIPYIIKPYNFFKNSSGGMEESPRVFSIDPFKTYDNLLLLFTSDISIDKSFYFGKIFIKTNRGTFTCDITIKTINKKNEPLDSYYKKNKNFYDITLKSFEENSPKSVLEFLTHMYDSKEN